ncbi:MAG TPA: MerR family DNA-binding transcriptional regulator [Alphaproteobacteria bacterium]|nr:MerR family DNA-binding transcriptional regulator [Alphaproteobacteria bacterium]
MPRRKAPRADAAPSRADAATFSIADLAREFDVTTRTIRFYEAEGLIAPSRRGQHRIFSPRDRVRLRLILRGKRLGFSLGEIRDIIDLYDRAPGEAGQLRFFLGKIRERRAELELQRTDIAETLAELAEVEARCLEQLGRLGGGRKRRR